MDLGTEYLAIALRLRRLVPDWVESYIGPPGLADAIDREEPVGAVELQQRVEEFAQRVEAEEESADRRCWLLAQLRGISTALRWLSGGEFDYAQRFAMCHGGQVEHVPDGQFEEAYAVLDRALPGRGDVWERYRGWRETQLVPRERLHEGLEVLGAEMRRRSREMFGLPDDERVTWEVVGDERWAGKADYLGQRHTLIRINGDLPVSSARLLELVCHEAYPGHHTHGVFRDASLIEAAGRLELCVYVYPTPQALISEGVGCLALHALLGDEAENVAADCLQEIGVAYDAATATAVREAEELLLPVRSNIAMMIDGGRTSAEVREYAKAWLLDEREQLEKALTDLEARSWLPYESCYPVGLVLCRRYTAGRTEAFKHLLDRQLTPADLTADSAA